MAVIKAKKVEFRVLKQEIDGAAAKYMMTLSYEPDGFESKELLNIVLADETPYIEIGVETENITKILQRTGPTVGEHPDSLGIMSPEEIYFNRSQHNQTGKLTPGEFEWQSKK